MLILAGMLGVIVAILVWPGEREPEYQGKTLSEWLRYPNSDLQETAVRAIGTHALPWLLKWIQKDRPASKSLKVNLRTLLRRESGEVPGIPVLKPWLDRPTDDDRDMGLKGFYLLGPRASSAIPELTRLMNESKSPAVSASALSALGAIGQEALPILVAALDNPQAQNRGNVAYRIATMARRGTDAKAAVPVLIKCLRDKDTEVAEAAARSLGELALSPKIVVPALTNAMQDRRVVVRVASIRALEPFRAQAAPAIPQLVARLADGNPAVAQYAAGALGKIGQEPETVVPALAASLQSTNRAVRAFALLALGRFGSNAQPAMEAIRGQLNDRDFEIRRQATNALQAIEARRE